MYIGPLAIGNQCVVNSVNTHSAKNAHPLWWAFHGPPPLVVASTNMRDGILLNTCMSSRQKMQRPIFMLPGLHESVLFKCFFVCIKSAYSLRYITCKVHQMNKQKFPFHSCFECPCMKAPTFCSSLGPDNAQFSIMAWPRYVLLASLALLSMESKATATGLQFKRTITSSDTSKQ